MGSHRVELTSHVVHINEGLGMDSRKRLGGRHAHSEAACHPRAPCHGNTVHIVDGELGVPERCGDRGGDIGMMAACSKQGVDPLGVRVVLSEYHVGEDAPVVRHHRSAGVVTRTEVSTPCKVRSSHLSIPRITRSRAVGLEENVRAGARRRHRNVRAVLCREAQASIVVERQILEAAADVEVPMAAGGCRTISGVSMGTALDVQFDAGVPVPRLRMAALLAAFHGTLKHLARCVRIFW